MLSSFGVIATNRGALFLPHLPKPRFWSLDMTDEELAAKKTELLKMIDQYRYDCAHYRNKFTTWKNGTFWFGLLSSLGSAVAGGFGSNRIPIVCGALGAAVVSVQSYCKFAERTAYYQHAVATCDRLKGKLKFQCDSTAAFDAIFESFSDLRDREGDVEIPTQKPVLGQVP
jgi:hypothetical protein